MYINLVKFFFDFLVSLLLMIFLSPLFIILMVLLFTFQNRSVFFTQPRVGKEGRIFSVIKFKTMNDKRDIAGNVLKDELRLTAIGKFIRKTSLDELPQLWNVLKGDMSLVGPRPLLVEYLPLYSSEQSKRHLVKPGITGWAQINGRNSISWKEKFQYDVWYVDHISFLLDLKILFITFVKVLRAEGISGRGVATSQKFNGNN
jgi:undecaprenyl phosphate N,N'-diacetylbacillosamine 1-phosphate transferase